MNGILADEMGLGKTVQIIALISHLYETGSGPYLIVAPLSTLPNWRDEFTRFAPKLPVIVFHGNRDDRKLLKENINKKYDVNGKKVSPIVITNYSQILLEENFFVSTAWKHLILDEGHKIKNSASKLHRYV